MTHDKKAEYAANLSKTVISAMKETYEDEGETNAKRSTDNVIKAMGAGMVVLIEEIATLKARIDALEGQ